MCRKCSVSEKFNRIFLDRQVVCIVISKMAKFCSASLNKDRRVISIVLRKNVPFFMSRKNVTKNCHENCSFIKIFISAPWRDWLARS